MVAEAGLVRGRHTYVRREGSGWGRRGILWWGFRNYTFYVGWGLQYVTVMYDGVGDMYDGEWRGVADI